MNPVTAAIKKAALRRIEFLEKKLKQDEIERWAEVFERMAMQVDRKKEAA